MRSFRFGPTGPPCLAAILFVSLMASQASAITVQYSTTGSFNGGGDTLTVGTSTIKFNSFADLDDIAVNAAPVSKVLGTFNLSSLADIADNFSATFTLTINQLLPSGSTQFAGQLSGTLKKFSNSTLEIQFTNTSAFADPVLYELTNLKPNTTDVVQIGNGGSITANVSVVPLPAAAWGGMALFGVLGGAKLRRSRQQLV